MNCRARPCDHRYGMNLNYMPQIKNCKIIMSEFYVLITMHES
jgi:hypothetical protein